MGLIFGFNAEGKSSKDQSFSCRQHQSIQIKQA